MTPTFLEQATLKIANNFIGYENHVKKAVERHGVIEFPAAREIKLLILLHSQGI
jgi:hypothetical protein